MLSSNNTINAPRWFVKIWQQTCAQSTSTWHVFRTLNYSWLSSRHRNGLAYIWRMCVIFGLRFEPGAHAITSWCIWCSLNMLRVNLTDIQRVRIVLFLLIEFIGLHIWKSSRFCISLHCSWSITKGSSSDHTSCHTSFTVTTIRWASETMVTHTRILYRIKNVWSFQLYFSSCFCIFANKWIYFDIFNIMSLRSLTHLPRLYCPQRFSLWW